MNSIFQTGKNCMQTACANRAAMLIDGDAYFKAFVQSAEHACHSIIILAWDFDSRTNLAPQCQQSATPALLGDFLNYLVRRRRALHIYVLDWDYPMIFGTDREFPPLYGLNWVPHKRVHFEYDNTHPVGGSHHQKIVVIDDAVAFSGGLDLTSRRWDTCEHKAEEPCRESNGNPYPPFHDAMAMVDGDAARALGTIARTRWQRATGQIIPPSKSDNEIWPASIKPDFLDVATAISRTMPETENEQEIREVEQLYLDMIAIAKRYIYIENQYFTAHRLSAALAQRLQEKDGPEVIIVLRLLSHGWLEEVTMHTLRTKLIDELKKADRWNKLGIYYPNIGGLKEGTCIDVHSKVMIVDDEWLRIGSANISNRSMGMDSECDVTFEAAGESAKRTAIAGLRDNLLAEHLDTSPQQIADVYATENSLKRTIKAIDHGDRTLKPLINPEISPMMVDVVSFADPEKPISLDKLATQFAPTTPQQQKGPSWRILISAVLLLAFFAGLWHFSPLAEAVTPDKAADLARDIGSRWWTPLIVLVAYTPASLILFPRPLITLFAVIALGAWAGALWALGGVLIAALFTYFSGRMMKKTTVRKLAGDRLDHVTKILKKKELLAITALRIVPVAPFAVIGLVAGAIRVKTLHYALGSLIGFMPGTITTVILGDQLETALRNPSEINYWLIVTVVCAFIAGILAVRYFVFGGAFFKKTDQQTSYPATTGQLKGEARH